MLNRSAGKRKRGRSKERMTSCDAGQGQYLALMKMVAKEIPGYTYGSGSVAASPVSLEELERLKQSVGFGPEDEKYLRLAGEVLADQTEKLVGQWRGIIAETPHLGRHTRTPTGQPIENYSKNSGLRLQQWVLDTCLRPYDQDWLNYQQEIALRHTSLKKNQADQVESTPYVPLRDVIGFVAIINETIKPFLAAKSHSPEEVEKMHGAWCKSVQLQIALWSEPYAKSNQAPNQW